MASPGITKNASLGNDWQQLGSLYNPATDNPKIIKDGDMIANQVWISVNTKTAEVAFSDAQPAAEVTQGHPLAALDSVTWNNQLFISRAWFRADTAGEVPVLTITPIYE
jgi:hypothetical protein